MSRTRRVTVAFLVICGLLATGVSWAVYRFFCPAPRVIAVSDSPDGTLQCIVSVKPPPATMYSPYIHRFRIIDTWTGDDWAGGTMVINGDSCVLFNQLTFEWAPKKLIIYEGSGYQKKMVAEADLTQPQQWHDRYSILMDGLVESTQPAEDTDTRQDQ